MVFVRPLCPFDARRPWLVALALAPTFNKIHVPRAGPRWWSRAAGLERHGCLRPEVVLVVDGEHKKVSVGTRPTVIEAREASWAVAVVAPWALRRRSCSLGQAFVIAVIKCPGLREAVPALYAVLHIVLLFRWQKGCAVYCCLLVHISGVNARATAICARDQGARQDSEKKVGWIMSGVLLLWRATGGRNWDTGGRGGKIGWVRASCEAPPAATCVPRNNI